ncbi:hypothetical protein EYF80_032351 [Liparis tanakae]|uniref:Uncharacterized protein n=1 Tax=Liparis tanakae TaxID=230148 RepID=A0A4Z2GXE0_9TELE|nr:hypothetical protein EYF80_032351 [Liparis tanakae]
MDTKQAAGTRVGDRRSKSRTGQWETGEQWAAVKLLGVQCLAQGRFDLQLMGRAGIEPTTSGLQDDPLTPLSYSRRSGFLHKLAPTAKPKVGGA